MMTCKSAMAFISHAFLFPWKFVHSVSILFIIYDMVITTEDMWPYTDVKQVLHGLCCIEFFNAHAQIVWPSRKETKDHLKRAEQVVNCKYMYILYVDSKRNNTNIYII